MKRIYVYLLLLIFILTSGCGSFESADKPPDADIIFSFELPSMLSQPAIPDLQAEISVDGEAVTTIQIDNEDTPIRVSINDISAGSHTFTVTYFTTTEQGRIDIASGSSAAEINIENETNITLENINRNIDDDHDGFTNLAEIRLETDPLDENDRPLSPLPLSAGRYILLDTIEGELYEGERETKGGRYKIEDIL